MGLQEVIHWGAEAGAASPPPLPPSQLPLGGERHQPSCPGEDMDPPLPPSLPASRRSCGAMQAAWLFLLALGLPCCPGCCRCPWGGPQGLPPTASGRNETLAGSGQPRVPDVAVLVAVGGWLGAVLAYVGRYVRRSRADTRLHLEYLRALPCRRPSPEEEETLSTIL